MTNGNQFHLGMIGLGVMGRNLVLNIADHGFPVGGYDRELAKVESLKEEAGTRAVGVARTLDEFVALLRAPRTVLLLVPAGDPVDAVIAELLPRLQKNDMIVDCGNSHFKDTDRRLRAMEGKGILYMGVGISGGEYGARHGPSIMPGGSTEGYERVRGVFEAVAANVDGRPMVTFLGPGSAGHYVKMVHNGIEYGLLQLIAETYHFLKQAMGSTNQELHDIFEEWNRSEASGYLIDVAARVFATMDDKTGGPLIDVILDEAKQKGTGKWTSQDAMDLHVPVPTIDASVSMRDLSGYREERITAGGLLRGPAGQYDGDRKEMIAALHNAFYSAMIVTFAQGLAQLAAASKAHGYRLALAEVAGIWRGGCIIRAALLEKIADAYSRHPELPNLLVDEGLAKELTARQTDWRLVVSGAAKMGIPAPALMSSLAYFDAYRSRWLPANLIQAARDFFGSHTYQRVDAEGAFHTEWQEQ